MRPGIGRIKQESNIPLYQPDRESEVLATPKAKTKGRSPTPRSPPL